MAISSTSSALFSVDFLAVALRFLSLPIKRSFFIDLGFEVDSTHSRHGGLSRKQMRQRKVMLRVGYLLYRNPTTV